MVTKERHQKLIIVLSIAIPVVVSLLFKVKIKGIDLTFLPPVYATFNGLTAIFLLVALWAIKRGKKTLHEYMMKICMGLSASFLLMYVLYHSTSDSTSFGGVGPIRYVYFFLLISHIVLSIAVVPLVLFTFSKALWKDFEKHKYLARLAFPIWFYVASSGVIVYFMIRPYY